MRRIITSIVFLLCFNILNVEADVPNISYVSGSGPYPLGTISADIVVATDVSSACRYNDVDDGNPSQWLPFSSDDNLIHNVAIALSNDEDTSRFIRCKNLSTNEVNTSSYVFSITFDNSNSAPTISSSAITLATEDILYSYDVDATDPDAGDVLTFSLSSFPSGMTIDSLSGEIIWTPTNDAVGENSVVVVATDEGGLSDSQTFTISVSNVNDAPVITSEAITNVSEGALFSYNVEADDPDIGDTLTYSLTISPAGMTIDTTTGLISWVPDNSELGDNSVTVIVSDAAGLIDTQEFIIFVSEVNLAPSITSIAFTSGTEDSTYSYNVEASDPNIEDTLTYSLSSFPSGMTIGVSSGLIDWLPSNEQVGEQLVVVLVTDSGGLSDSQTFTIVVANVNDAPSISSTAVTVATENISYSYDVDATDPDAVDTLTFSLSSFPIGMTIDANTGMINWTPTSTQLGNQTVVVEVTDLEGLSDSQTYSIIVNAVNDIGPVVSYVSGSGPHELGTTIVDMVVSTDVDATCRYNDIDDGNPAQWAGMSTTDNRTHSAQISLASDEDVTRYIRCRTNGTSDINTVSFVFPILFVSANAAPTISTVAPTTATQDISYLYDVDATDPDLGDTLTFSLSVSPSDMTIDASTGVINWTPVNTDVGNQDVTVVVTDTAGLTDSQSFTIAVSDVNEAPSITSVAVIAGSENVAYVYDVDATDPDAGDILIFSLSASPSDMTIDASTGVINWTPVNTDVGNQDVTVVVTDTAGLTDSQSFTIAVSDVNEAPSITSVAVITGSENVAYVYDVDATDPDAGDILIFSLSASPSDMTIDASTGVINWTPVNTDVGNQDVTVVVTDTAGLTDSQSFTIAVSGANVAPSITSTAVTTATENSAYSYDVDATDAGDTLTYSLSVFPSSMTIDPNTGVISWTPIAADVGDQLVTVLVTDEGGLTDSQSFTITVSGANVAPSITSTAVTTATENSAYSYDVDATDPDAGDTLLYSLTVFPGGMTIDEDNGVINWTPSTADVGNQSVTVVVTDDEGLLDSQSFTIVVEAVDSDGDGVVDTVDQCPATPSDETADENGCSPSQLDTDNDGITDDLDQCPDTPVDEIADNTGCSPSQVAESADSSRIPQTGSTYVFLESDDTSLAKGTERSFSRNSVEEVVIDNTNGLTWQDNLDAKTNRLTWNDAISYCADSTHANITDWRLPTKLELLYLLDFDQDIVDGDAAIDPAFLNSDSERYWTDHYRLIELSGGSTVEMALAVDFGDRKIKDNRFQNKIDTALFAVRCVSGSEGQFVPSFEPESGEQNVVLDSTNNLLWQDNSDVGETLLSLSEAISYCEDLTLDGATDWRLPNINELHSITGDDNFNPDNEASLENTWSSTLLAPNSNYPNGAYVLSVSFDDFESQTDSNVTSQNYIRCVKDYTAMVVVSGGDRTASVGDDIIFDSSGSSFSSGTNVTYRWYDADDFDIIFGKIFYNTIYSTEASFVSNTFEIGTHNIVLEITDGHGFISTDGFTVTVVAQPNVAPTAISKNVEVTEDLPQDILLQASDSNGDILTYSIVGLPTNGSVVLVGTDTATYTPDIDYFGSDSFTFKVNDGEFDSNTATITIDVISVNGGAPTANAGEDITVLLGAAVSLDGSASTDDEQIVSYEWTFDSNVVSTNPSFDVLDLGVGIHVYTLTVYDAEGLSGTDSVSITVNYPLDQCTISQNESDYGFVDVFPEEDINWTGSSFTDVLEIEAAFNHARQTDQSVFKFLNMPEQSEWDGFTIQQKALYLINSEREARGIKPFTGASPQVVTVAQNYADYLKDNNEVITHTRSSDGASPKDRLEEDPDILANNEGTSENLYGAFYSLSDSEAMVDAIYRWLYMDKQPLSGSAWGHRKNILRTGFIENNDSQFEEGLIGLGIATGDYDPLGVSIDGQGAVVVFNSIDQKSAWDNSNTETVDISNAHLCNTDVPLVLDETQFETANLSSITISPTHISLNPGDSSEIKVNAYYSDGTSQDISAAVSFIADTRSIVSVSAGVVTAETTGYATLFASVAGVDSNRLTVVVGEETDTSNLTGTYGEEYLSYVPTNSTISHYDPKTFTLFNGTVLDRNNMPMAGVTISFHNSPQYGSVVTDSLGQFIIAGEAGRRTIVYSREGYVTLQRTTNAISNSWKTIENVILLEKDSKVTSIDLSSGVAQTHQSTIITDEFGSRATTLVFSGINQATITAQDGSTRILDEFLVRATEAEFPESMPAYLPEETEFTYCSDLDIVGVGYDEAVEFDNPVVMYVDNFLGFPVGEIVPIGYFTGRSTTWESSDNGVVVKLLDSDSNGLVDGVDYTGDDIADDIDGDGSTTDEIAGIENYNPGELYWRGKFDHFTWYDFNWGYATPAVEPLTVLPEPNKEDKDDKDCVSTNSYVKPKPLALHEDIPVTGTNLTLHYSSQRTHGYHHKIAVNVSDETIPEGLTDIVAILEIGGNRFEKTFPAAVLQDAEFIWDGTDPDGNVIQGLVTGKISVGHKLLDEYSSAGNATTSGEPLDSFANAWAQYGSETTGISGREEQIIWSTSPVEVFNSPESQIANGWSLSNHHVAAGSDLIHRGDGEAQEVKPVSLILKTGILDSQHSGDDGFYQKGGSSIDYEINEQGDLHDKVTGLTWEYLLNPVSRYDTFANAQAHCDSLNLGGEDENNTWRIPTSKEIAYSIDKSNGAHDFSLYTPDALNYWVEGRIEPEDGAYPLLCVKGEKLDNRYIADMVRNETDQIVIDQQNGLMWQDVPENATETYSWTDSIDYCEALDHAGYTDWRLPNVNEILYALPNSTFVNQTELDFTQGQWYPGVSFRKPYWTSTPDAVNDGVAWAVESLSYSAGYTQDDLYYARCVRDDLTRSRSPFIFDENGHHVKTIDLDSGVTLTTFEYDSDGRLVKIQDRFENTITIERDESGKATTIVSPDGYTTTLTVDSLNDLARAEYDDGTSYDFVYENSLMTEETDPNRNLFVKTYDATGRIEQTEDPEEGIWQFFNIKDEVEKILTYGYGTSENNNYEVAISTLENGDTSLVTTNKDGSTSEETRQQDKLKDTFTSSGVVTVVDKVVDSKTRLEIPQSITTTLPSGLQNITTIDKSYAENGSDTSKLTISITDNGHTNTLSEDFKTGVKTITSAEGRIATFNYNPLTRLLESQQVSGFNDIVYTYDSRGRIVTSTIGDRVTNFAYDDPISKGNITSITDAENRVTSFEYDLLGRLTKTTYPDGRLLEQSFDANGNLASLTPPGQPAHIFNYNGVDKKKQYTPPDVAGVTTPQTVYEYDKDRKLTSITRPDNQVLTFNYRLNTDQLTSLSIPTGDYTYGYDDNQELTSIIAPDGESLTFTLDGAIQTKAEWSGEIAGNVEVVLDNQFKITEQKINGGNSILLSYDNDNLLTGAGSLNLTRDANNGLITATSQTNMNTSQSYNSYAEILNFNASYNTTSLYNVDYTQDKLGRITQQIETIEGVTRTLDYAYDLAGRLIQVKTNGVETESYAYDSNGNRTQVNGLLTATYDEQDRLLAHGDFTYTYTDNGELLTKTNTTNNEVTNYVYDVLGNLIEVNLPDGTKIEYIIDGLNRRVGKKVNGIKTKGWLYQDQLNPVAELDGNNNITARFVYGDKINVPSYMEREGQTYRIISDHLGSPRLVINTSTGEVGQRMDFDTWGNVINDTNPEFQPFGFAGGIYETKTGLTRFGARDYASSVGRWTSKDPIRFHGGSAGLYSYVGNDPINFLDPTGLYCLTQNVISTIASLGGAVVTGLITGGPAGAIAAIAVAAGTAIVTSYVGGSTQTSAAIGVAAGGISFSGGKTKASIGGLAGGLIAAGGGDSTVGKVGAATVGGALGSFAGAIKGESGSGFTALKNMAKAAKGGFWGSLVQAGLEALIEKYNDCEEECGKKK